MSRVALLDVNLLIALFDPNHVHHEVAHDWFADNHAHGWATCPITENGFLRVVANPSYGSGARTAALIGSLRTFCASGHHHFWADVVSLADEALFQPRLAPGHRQLTDVYLLGLARKMGGRLATFDKTIPIGAVVGATTGLLQTIAPDERH